MKRSTRELVGVQLAGLLLAIVFATTLIMATPAPSAMLSDLSGREPYSFESIRPEMSNHYTSQDGTLDMDAYLVFEAACRSTALCLGVPVSFRSLPGVRIRFLSVLARTACSPSPVRACAASLGCPAGRAIETPCVAQMRTRNEKNRTAERSGQR